MLCFQLARARPNININFVIIEKVYSIIYSSGGLDGSLQLLCQDGYIIDVILSFQPCLLIL